jgi:hypothetical protein
MTHIVIKLFAMILEKSPGLKFNLDVNGRIVFGKYVPCS